MKNLITAALATLLAVALPAAERIHFKGKDLVDGAKRPPIPQADADAFAAAQAKAATLTRDGIRIRAMHTDANGWAMVALTNTTSSTVTLDYHQIRGLEMDTGNIVPAGDVRFELREIATYALDPNQTRTFRIAFAGRKVIAVAWAGSDQYITDANLGKAATTTAPEALRLTRTEAAKQRMAQKAHQLTPAPGFSPLPK